MAKKDKAKKLPTREEIVKQLGGKQPVNLFACPDCELLIFEYPDTNEIQCPWCRKKLDMHVMYSFVCFARGVQFSRTFNSGQMVIVE